MARSATKDLTRGSSIKQILGFMIPLVFGLIFQQMYGMVDSMVVGRTLGVNALAGVGSTGSLNYFIVGFCTGTASGFAIPIAKKFGEGDYDGLRRFVGNIIWLSSIFSIILAALTVVFCDNILTFMDTPEDVFSYAYGYIVVIFAGIPITVAYNILAGIIRSLGDSRSPVVFLMISGVLNVFLDLLFILVFDMGVVGASLATIISQLVSALLCLILIIKRFDILRLTRSDLRPNAGYIGTLCGMGFPMGLQCSLTAIGSLVLQTSINNLGSVYVAATTASAKVQAIFNCPFEAMGTTMATFAGQNLGAGKIGRIRRGYREACIIGTVYSVLSFGMVCLFGKSILVLFIDNPTEQLVGLTQQNFVITSAFYIFLMLVFVTRLLIQGLGYTKIAMVAGIFEMVARAFVGLVLVPNFGYIGACFSGPLAWILATAFLVPMYIVIIKRLRDKQRHHTLNLN